EDLIDKELQLAHMQLFELKYKFKRGNFSGSQWLTNPCDLLDKLNISQAKLGTTILLANQIQEL
ncbi:38987_t:CDS:1, partial [Gigaspora margarita]